MPLDTLVGSGRERLRRLRRQLSGALIEGSYRGNLNRGIRELLERRIVSELVDGEVGREYGLTRRDKLELLRRIQDVPKHIESATSWIYHVVLATKILSVPTQTVGSVVECGCYKGASTASLSIACEYASRRLYVCDSFEGFPEESGEAHHWLHFGVHGHYEKGMYNATLEEVKSNISRYGAISSCRFIEGLFADSLHQLQSPVVFAFFDVALASSTRDAIRGVWPKLVDGGYIYTDDSPDVEVMKIWFNDAWWKENLECPAPGYVGTGCGLPIRTGRCSLGYARKVSSPDDAYDRVGWLVYPGDKGEGE